MKILVTGGAGFVGSYIVDELVRRGHEVRIFDNLDPQVHPDSTAPDYLNSQAEFIQGDVRDIDALKQALDGIEVVFHEAAAVGVGQSQYKIKHYVDVNTGGTANLLDILANNKHSVKKLIVAASQCNYGEGMFECPEDGLMKGKLRPLEQMERHVWPLISPKGHPMKPMPTPETATLDCQNIYGITKRDQEDMVMGICQTYNIPAVALRYFNVYGPRQSLSNPYTGVLAIFISRYANGKAPVIYEDGGQARDFISVHDVVQANMLAMEKEEANYQTFNVGYGEPTSILEIATMLAEVYGVDIKPELPGQFRKGDTRCCYADISKIKNALGFDPKVSLREGMEELVEWSRNQEANDQFEQATQELKERGLV